jgi:predicted CXXCH cytochrome family protein
MNRRLQLACWFLGLTLLAAANLGCGSSGVQPRFPHSTHLRSGSLTCTNCHAVTESTAVGKLHQPGYDICRRCHSASVGPGEKYSFDLSRTLSADPDYDHVIYSHKDHHPRTKGQCVRCHHVGTEADANPQALLPSMADCLTCHQGEYDRVHCTGCHTPARLAKLRPVTDVSHGTNYVRQHAADAARKPRLCQACHSEHFCTDCHDTGTGVRVELRRLDDIKGEYVHRADFVSRHSIEARARPSACVRCHQPSSCDSCHVRNRVSANSHGAASPHPAGWTGRDASNPNYHGRAARRQIIECAACHDQGPATNCIACHKVGASGGNPHPSGWRTNLSPRDTEMCQYCHSR